MNVEIDALWKMKFFSWSKTFLKFYSTEGNWYNYQFTGIWEFRDVIIVVKHFWYSVNWETIHDLWKYGWVQTTDVFMRIPKKSAVSDSQITKWPAIKRNGGGLVLDFVRLMLNQLQQKLKFKLSLANLRYKYFVCDDNGLCKCSWTNHIIFH